MISFNQAMDDEDDRRQWDRLASSDETSDVSGIISVQSPPPFYSSSPSRSSSPSSPPEPTIPTRSVLDAWRCKIYIGRQFRHRIS